MIPVSSGGGGFRFRGGVTGGSEVASVYTCKPPDMGSWDELWTIYIVFDGSLRSLNGRCSRAGSPGTLFPAALRFRGVRASSLFALLGPLLFPLAAPSDVLAISTSTLFLPTGEAAFDNFGRSVSTAGDVNGDGFDDVIMGATKHDAGGSDAGRAYVYDCNRFHVLTPSGGGLWNVGAEESITWSGAALADVWLSVDRGDSYSLLRDNVGGLMSNAVRLTVPHRPTRFAKVKVTPHDATVTGRAESDSLFTIEASIALLNLKAEPIDGGGVLLTWETDPGPEDLAGYKVDIIHRLTYGEKPCLCGKCSP